MRLPVTVARIATLLFASCMLVGCFTTPRHYTGSDTLDLGGPPRTPAYLNAAVEVGATLGFGVGGRTSDSITLQRQSSAIMNYFTSSHEQTSITVSFSDGGRKIDLMIFMIGGTGPSADVEANNIINQLKAGLRSRLEPPPQPAPVAAPPPKVPSKAAPKQRQQRKTQ
jgi:hypothetical protein